MTYITTKDGTQIFYKDWGPKDAQPIVFHHGWPLSADDWDNQMMFFLAKGYRVIAHDRRGHGRSSQTDGGNEMDTYASDVAELVAALDLKNAIHIGHSTGGGEVAHYVARAEPGRVAKAVLIDAVPPVMVKKEFEPGRHADRGVRRIPRRARRQPRPALPRYPDRPLLRLQPAGREGVGRPDPQLVAAGHDGQRQGRLRVHQGLLRNRLHRGSEGDRRAGAGDPQRGRPDRALCGFGAADGQAAEERHAQDLQGPAARLLPDPSRDRECRHPRLHSRGGSESGSAERPPPRLSWREPEVRARPRGRARTTSTGAPFKK